MNNRKRREKKQEMYLSSQKCIIKVWFGEQGLN